MLLLKKKTNLPLFLVFISFNYKAQSNTKLHETAVDSSLTLKLKVRHEVTLQYESDLASCYKHGVTSDWQSNFWAFRLLT